MKSFPFDSDVTYDAEGNPEYDRGADSTILSDFIHLMFTDGVFPNPSTGLQVTASSEEMSVVVKPGNCMIQGRMGIEESERTLVFNASGTTYDRIDSVVARLNTNHDYRDIDLYVVKGTEASTPTAPELTRTGGIYELRLANVFIAKNTTLISAERITDTRLADECGIVTSNPNSVDTATIFNQYQAALDKYLQYVQECIDGTTAGNLQTQIDELRDVNASQNETLKQLNTNLDDISSTLDVQIENVGPFSLLTTPNKDSIVTAINSLKDLSLPKTVNIKCSLVANKQGEWIAFSFLPLHRADLYNIEFTKQAMVGVDKVGLFSAERFHIEAMKNGFEIFSYDKDVEWFFQNGGIYEFFGTATLK